MDYTLSSKLAVDLFLLQVQLTIPSDIIQSQVNGEVAKFTNLEEK